MRNLHKCLAAVLLCSAVAVAAPSSAQVRGAGGAAGMGGTLGGLGANGDAGVDATVRPGLNSGAGDAGVNAVVRPGLNTGFGVGNAGVNAEVRPGLTTGAGFGDDAGVILPPVPGLAAGATSEEVNRAADLAIARANAAAARAGAPVTGSLGAPEVPAAGTAP